METIQFYNGTMLSLPNGVGNFFKNLKIFTVGYSYSSYLGTKFVKRSNFKNLNKLEKLEFYRNDIAELDEDCLWDLENLNEFRLLRNKLKALHVRTFEKNVRLTKIKMHSNEIDFLPRDIFRHNLLLEEIDFAKNLLKTIDEETFKFNRNLQVLYLHSNQLKVLPGNIFANNFLLQSLSLFNNSITLIDENIFQKNGKLLWLSLGSNRLEFLPRSLFKNNSVLYKISFDNNLLKAIETDFTENENFWHIGINKNSCIDLRYDLKSITDSAIETKNLTEFQLLINTHCQKMTEGFSRKR